ncbi:MAG: anti-sigma factor family protein [bacterium]
MNCFDTEQKLGSYVERVCSEAERHEIEAHLQTCGHCTQQVKALHQIDILLKNETFPQPSEEYWLELPKTIIRRLGLSQPLTFQNKVSQFVNALAVPKHIAWSMTGAVAVMVTLFLIMHRERPISGSPPIAEQQVTLEASASSGENTSPNNPPQANSIAQKPAKIPGAVPQLPEVDKGTNSKEKSRKASNESPSDLAMETRPEGLRNKTFSAPLQGVAILPVRHDKLMKPKYERVVYPVPYMMFTTTTDFVQEDDDSRRREIQTYSFDHGRQTPRTRRPDKVNDLKVQESEFYEILWIAQESYQKNAIFGCLI